MRYKSFHRYRYVYRHRVDKACLVSTSSPESLLYQFFTTDNECHRYHHCDQFYILFIHS
ncbi:hypothetical protein [Desulforhopalus vacuolatus]|uniref:hypothetical protein n=1 Tax=Desulforhopalus vacuolatus TaxID=40414 RepID=UPI0019664920|nr:hypothetical protein [Desulforhopalus vacuolatus]